MGNNIPNPITATTVVSRSKLHFSQHLATVQADAAQQVDSEHLGQG